METNNKEIKRRSTFAVLFYINRTKVRKDGTIYILIIVPGLSGADNYILPYSLKLRSSQWFSFAAVSYTHLYGSKIKVFGTEIPHSVRAKEISAEGKSIFAHDPGGKVAEGYKNLTKSANKKSIGK